MPLKIHEDIFNLFHTIQNLIQRGHIEDIKDGEVLVKFSEDCSLWLKALTLKSGLSFPLEIGENILVFCPHGDLTEALVWGSLDDNGSAKGFQLETKDTATIKAKSGLHLGNGTVELITLMIDALKIIATSKTPTLAGPQLSIESSTQLPQIILKLESLCA